MEAVTWRDMAALHPWLNPLRELRATLAQMRWNGPSVGSDGRNRFTAWAFSTKTSRCAPRARENVFGLACWARSLVRPDDGTALLYCDWVAQEFALAGALSNDSQMLSDYRNGDPYLIFAVRAQLAPSNATKRSHSVVRARCKIATLADNYGQGARGLSLRLGIDEVYARDLIQRVAAAYPRHRQWMDRTVDHAMIFGRLDSPFGWRLWITPDTKVGTILNWKLQTLGAELLRIATIVTVEEGWDVVATLHDALLIQAPVELVDIAKARITDIMRHAADVVTQGRLDLRVDVTEIPPGQRFVDERGVGMWQRVMALLDQQESVAWAV